MTFVRRAGLQTEAENRLLRLRRLRRLTVHPGLCRLAIIHPASLRQSCPGSHTGHCWFCRFQKIQPNEILVIEGGHSVFRPIVWLGIVLLKPGIAGEHGWQDLLDGDTTTLGDHMKVSGLGQITQVNHGTLAQLGE